MAGAKVSKSRGNIVDPVELVKKYGVDAFRYFLLREVTIGLDGAFSEDLLAERYTSDLANDLGNLWFRLASMVEKYFDGRIPSVAFGASEQKEALAPFKPMWRDVDSAMTNYDPRTALGHIWNTITEANQSIERKAPWKLAKDPSRKDELAKFLVTLAELLAHTAVILLPFLPQTARKILERLQLPAQWVIKRGDEFERSMVKAGARIERGGALFPRLDEVDTANP